MEDVQICFECLNKYFEGDPPHDQFFCRALMCQGQLMSLWNWWQVYCMNISVFSLFFCIFFVSYSTHFLVFNTSVLYFQGVRPLLQPGMCHHLVPSLKQVVKVLTEEDSVKLREIFSLLVDSAKVIGAPVHSGSKQIPTPIQPCDRFVTQSVQVKSPLFLNRRLPETFSLGDEHGSDYAIQIITFLLELALLSLQVKDQEVAVNCWEQLKLAEELVMLCCHCQRRNPQCAGVLPQARLKEIEKLDQWLEAAVKEGRPQAAQALCASQWNLCLPLLQHNLRKCIKMPLLKLGLVLEYTQSMSLEMRCEVHSELAAIEEEDGDLKASLSHLEKALLLDSGTYKERLLSALHLLQLRRTPYQTPAFPLDKAAKIITDRRPLLVSVGLLLAPFDFETILNKLIIYKSFLFSHYFRIKLWATLAKSARKLEVWDVCRAACRFCLLYDDGAGKSSESNSELMKFLSIKSKFVRVELIYRDWIKSLSAYATQCFLRGGEIGVHIGEHCLVENAAIYLWNYNAHMLAAEEYKLLLPTFQNLVEMLLRTKYIRYNLTMCVMVCNAAIRGLTQSACDSVRASAKERYRGSKQGILLDDAGLQDVKKALEVGLCEYALRISSGDRTRETVPIAVRKLVLTSWVQIKQLLHQQIGEKLDIFKDKVTLIRVLVGLEMLNCNKNPKYMDFSVPSLSTLVDMASDCSWLDAVVELQMWCQLAVFCHSAEDHSLVLRCTQKAFQLEKAAADSVTTAPCLLIAEKTGSQDLCVTAAGHFWNACLPLTQSPRDKWWLKEHLEKILNTLFHTRNCASVSHLICTLAHSLSQKFTYIRLGSECH
uniref:Cilia and flagella associated protein 46 n=1 Tax=Xiphophorus maculatus TaxID=8083 RepID=M3ZZE9_XIPMA